MCRYGEGKREAIDPIRDKSQTGQAIKGPPCLTKCSKDRRFVKHPFLYSCLSLQVIMLQSRIEIITNYSEPGTQIQMSQAPPNTS